jgi:hypothetical protein
MASPYPSVITVDGVVGNISRVTVTLKTHHAFLLSDVDMLLVGPNGQSAMIFSDVGTGQTVNNLTVMLSDAAPVPLAETGPITTGVFKPTNNPGEPVDLGDPFVAPAPWGPTHRRWRSSTGKQPMDSGLSTRWMMDPAIRG